MKVQIFPDGHLSGRFSPPLLGALTLKPSAFQYRPWEVVPLTVVDHLQGGPPLVFHLRGPRVMGVTQPGWIKDRVRFAYDGFRRQRLVDPLRGGRPVSWATALTVWLSLGGHRFGYYLDGGGFHFYWVFRVYNFLAHPRGRPWGVSVDVNRTCSSYHGAHGLAAAGPAELVLPGGTPWEEDGSLRGPGVTYFALAAAGVQLFRSPRGYTPGGYPPCGDSLPRESARAVFQVSPIQGLLGGW